MESVLESPTVDLSTSALEPIVSSPNRTLETHRSSESIHETRIAPCELGAGRDTVWNQRRQVPELGREPLPRRLDGARAVLRATRD